MLLIAKMIKRELEEIYKERKSWDGGKGNFTPTVIRYRELILIKQQVLYCLEDAVETQDKNKEIFYLEVLLIINNYLNQLKYQYEKDREI